MSKENQKELKKHEQLITTSLNWVSEASSMDPEGIKPTFELMFEAFLESDYADNGEDRRNVLVLKTQMSNLFGILEQYDREEFKAMDVFSYEFNGRRMADLEAQMQRP